MNMVGLAVLGIIAVGSLAGSSLHAGLFNRYAGALSPPTCTITGVSLSANSFPGGSPDGTVIGAITVSTTGTCGADTLSLTGTDASKFKLDTTSPPANLETSGPVASGSYSINIVATISGAVGSPFTQPETITGTGGYIGPGNVTTFTAWYGLRAYTTATAASNNKLINVKRTFDNRTCDIKAATAGGLGNTGGCSVGGDNGTLWSTWCAFSGGACNVVTIYDLSGHGHDAVFAGSVTIYAKLIDGCLNTSLPCIEMPLTAGGSTTYFDAGTFTTATGIISMNAVFDRSAGTTEFQWVGLYGSAIRIKSESPANFFTCRSGDETHINNSSVSDAAWHQSTCVINGASSALNIDGSTTTGSISLTPGTGLLALDQNNGNTGNIGRFAENGFTDNVAWTSPSDNCTSHPSNTVCSLYANQKAYWGTP